jgi:transglutaminase-like putative cysteine protease
MEPMVAFLLTAFALKLTEMRSRKDAYVVVFLGYFVCLTMFLFSQDLLLVCYGLLLVWVLTTALIAMQRRDAALRDTAPLRLSALMLAQAFPLMLVLFFLFPRIGPLWSVPLKSHAAQTGMSDRLRPGDVSRLSQSDEVAFRVQFAGEIPPVTELYWRGLVLSRFDGEEWRSLRYFEVPASQRREPPVQPQGAPLRYRVLMSPTQQNWLYGLRYARASRAGVMHLSDFRLYSPVVVESEYAYGVRSWPGTPLETELGDWRRNAETALPAGSNPRAVTLARTLYEAAGSDAAYVEDLLEFFRGGGFAYTLQPPTLPAENAMDAFLFGDRRGFCEHYAYAFALLARAVGIPARIVGGYLGGEVNPVNRTVIVHQFDAHAWNEVWLEGQGWVRVDPTAVVAPDRLLYGLEQAVAAEGSFLAATPLSPLRFRGVNW